MWALQRAGTTLMTLPKVAVLRGFVSEPQHSSPRPARSLSEAQRYSRTVDLRTVGGRKSVLVTDCLGRNKNQ